MAKLSLMLVLFAAVEKRSTYPIDRTLCSPLAGGCQFS